MGEERRKNKRVFQKLLVQVLFMNKSLPGGALEAQELLKFHEGVLLDVSSTGASMEMAGFDERWDALLRREDILVGMRFSIPDEDHPLSAVTKVRWIKRQAGSRAVSLGLCFVDISSLDRLLLRNYIINSKSAAV
ncbi:MAG: PilZ domain-containing protein [Candidatus Omnitrophica bacterium]|nr:PilZ domain-containing protein [Candidatus Omnitrophota bacterium]